MVSRYRILRNALLVSAMPVLLSSGQPASAAPAATQTPTAASPTAAVSPPSGENAKRQTAVAPPRFVGAGTDARHDVSLPLWAIVPTPPAPWTMIREMHEEKEEGDWLVAPAPPVRDPVVQRSFGGAADAVTAIPGTMQNFAGMTNPDGVVPPDTVGDVGPNHYVQWVNLYFQIFNKQGVSLYGPAVGATLWNGFGHPCDNHNNGDPMVLYDPMADRWVMAQFTSGSPFGECVAVSQTPDPTGSWNRYFFQFSTTSLYDYPHIGVWPDGYYMTANRGSVAAIAFDRQKMLQGLTAGYQEFDVSTNFSGTMLPADLDGPTLPPPGSPNYFMNRAGNNNLDIYKFHVDWTTPANSTFTGPTSLATAPYTSLCPSNRSCVAQPGTTRKLDALADRPMHRLAYRNFGDHESLVLNHAVDVGSGQAGVRWYEVRSPNASPFIYQQGTYAPDATSRWMASVAMDRAGNIAMGYNVSDAVSVHPGIRYTGRFATDPSGQMPQGEGTIINGGGSQLASVRWGDYATMSVDPADDCTFWFTGEYYATDSSATWQTRIASFKFASCNSCAGVVCAPLDQCHVAGTCDSQTGQCSNPIKPNGSSCDDGSACTVSDACTDGACAGTAASCDDANACTADACSTLTGCLHTFVDTDADGACDANDCAPANAAAFALPSEVVNLLLSPDRTTLTWTSAAPTAGSGTVHDVPRGLLSQLPVGGKPGEACLASGIAAATASDTATPAPGQGFWYLVRGRNACAAGTYGTTTAGTPRNVTACP